MCLFSIPMIVCSIILAPQIIHLLAGPGYEGAILPMRLIMPAVLPVGIAQVLAIQVLMPMKRDRAPLTASILGAAVSPRDQHRTGAPACRASARPSYCSAPRRP